MEKTIKVNVTSATGGRALRCADCLSEDHVSCIARKTYADEISLPCGCWICWDVNGNPTIVQSADDVAEQWSELRRYVNRQIDGIQRSSRTQASDGAMRAFYNVLNAMEFIEKGKRWTNKSSET